MFFQHFITDDFVRYQDVLNKKISVESMIQLLRATGEPFHLVESTNVNGETALTIELTKPGYLLILGKSFNKIDRARKYNSIKTWLNEDGFPVMCNVSALREEYPELHMFNDVQLAQFVYACTYPSDVSSKPFNFEEGNDNINMFIAGYNEYGVLSEFEDSVVSINKIKYLIQCGEKLTIT